MFRETELRVACIGCKQEFRSSELQIVEEGHRCERCQRQAEIAVHQARSMNSRCGACFAFLTDEESAEYPGDVGSSKPCRKDAMRGL